MIEAGNVVRVRYQTKDALNQAYMAFCRDGGIFVPMDKPEAMGSALFLLIELPDMPEILSVSGRVAWINFAKKAGVGIRFNSDEDGKTLRRHIENLLGGMLVSPNPTLTM